MKSWVANPNQKSREKSAIVGRAYAHGFRTELHPTKTRNKICRLTLRLFRILAATVDEEREGCTRVRRGTNDALDGNSN